MSTLDITDGRYFTLIRRLIETYTLEPAGSHGVWGLDDTSFLPFLLGSGQLKEQSSAPPTASITQPAIVEAWKDKNLYFDAIAWINKVYRPLQSLINRR
jgi:serine/threonine-protein phosphatase 2A activator